MPLPSPNKGESQKDFMSRCMGDDVMVKEYPDDKQRFAVCAKQWEEGRADESYEERTANEHECRLRNPDAFQKGSFRRTTREHDGKESSIIMGRLKNRTKMTEQAYRYADEAWDADDARAHCKDHAGTFTASTGSRSAEIRGAIKSHKTATSTKTWDGPANEARLKKDQDAAFYKRAYAWQDPD